MDVFYQVMELNVPKNNLNLITVNTRLFDDKEKAMELFYERSNYIRQVHKGDSIQKLHLCVGEDPYATEFNEEVIHFLLETDYHIFEITMDEITLNDNVDLDF